MASPPDPTPITLQVPKTAEGTRLDAFVTRACASLESGSLSRSAVQRLIENAHVRVNGETVRSNYRVQGGDDVRVDLPDPEPLNVVPEAIPLAVVFEDDHLIVVDKPAGMSTHVSPAEPTGTLVNALLAHCDNLSGINGVKRPGVVHRLDKGTTGLLVVAKDDATHRGVARQFEERSVERSYLALCWGHLEREGRIEAPVGRHSKDRTKMAVVKNGRRAVTTYQLAASYAFLSKANIRLETGRTHQIRVHLDHVGHPVFGDPVYNGRDKRLSGISPMYRVKAARILEISDRQMLHAQELGFVHPITKEPQSFEASPPADFQRVLGALEISWRVS